MKNKILLQMIVKDDSEAVMFARCLNSFMPYVDGLVVAFTGPSGDFDELEKIAKKHKATTIHVSPETNPLVYDNGKFANFAEARNIVLRYADEYMSDYQLYMWCDVDDVLQGGENLQKYADETVRYKFDASFFTYWYAVNVVDGSYSDADVEIDHIRERLWVPGKFVWKSRLHEVLVPKDDFKPRFKDYNYDRAKTDNVVWVHLNNAERLADQTDRNVMILKKQIEEEEGKDPRTLFYLARTYFDRNHEGDDDQAIDLIQKYLEMSGWEEERSNAWEYLGKIYERRGNYKLAIESMHEAIKEFPDRHMNYLLLSKYYFEVERFDKAQFFVDMALRMDAPKARTTIGNPVTIMFMAASIKFNLAMKKLDLHEAKKWWQTRLDVAKERDDGMLKSLDDAIYHNQIGLAIFNYAKYLKDYEHREKIDSLIKSIPDEYAQEPFIAKIVNEYAEPKKWSKKSIVYVAHFGGPFFEKWSPKNLAKGIGGSETAVIQLSKEWVKKGYEVTVYCDCQDDAGIYDGVEYKPWHQFNINDEFNIVIFWRSPMWLDYPIKANKLYVDLHDIASAIDYTPSRVEKVTGVFFKSKWHASQVPQLKDKAIVISNSITI